MIDEKLLKSFDSIFDKVVVNLGDALKEIKESLSPTELEMLKRHEEKAKDNIKNGKITPFK